MSSRPPEKSIVIRYLGPLIPVGFGCFGLWLLVTGRYVFRPGRSTTELVLLPPDSYIAGGFFICLAVLIAALGVSGKAERWLFWFGAGGAALLFAVEAGRQFLGVAAYG
jgi:hypothetical protein